VPTVGLCHEVVNARFFISQLLDCGFFDVDLTVVGVNHLPLITRVCVDGYDRMKDLFELASGGGDRDTPLPFLDRVMADPPIGTGGRPRPRRDGGSGWTKGGVIEHQAVNYEVLREHGALPGADSDHTCEFFPNFITEASGWGRQWGVHMVTIDERRRRETAYRKALGRRLGNHAIPSYRSPEMVAPVIESLLGAESCVLPLNIPNAGQCPQLPDRAVVESMCVVDRDGIRGRDRALAPSTLAKFAARVAASQELTVEAALSGDPELVLEALRTDPFSSRLDHHALNAVRDDILTSTRPWLAVF
jgi:alpha-galactosidase/6-phospho-beta-glucosidase family protein